MTLANELRDALRQYLLANIPADPGGEVMPLGLDRLLITWFNWRDRFVSEVRRTVHVSSTLGASPESATHAAALAAIRREIEGGEDITHRLSRGVATAYRPDVTTKRLQSQRHLDLLLSDWGIHHLHLSPTNDGARTPDLLFAMFRASDAFLLAILPHGSWTDERLIEIAVRDWPGVQLVTGSISGLRLAQPIAPEGRNRYRNAGVAVPIEMDGRLYMPRGLSLAGTAIDAAGRSNVVMHAIGKLERDTDASTTYLADLLASHGVTVPKPSVWRPYVVVGQFGVVDVANGIPVGVGAF